jgi:hypothetical protein
MILAGAAVANDGGHVNLLCGQHHPVPIDVD